MRAANCFPGLETKLTIQYCSMENWKKKLKYNKEINK